MEGLLINHPGIDDVGVVGAPDKEAGQVPRALVVRKPRSNISEKDIHAFVDGKFFFCTYIQMTKSISE